MDPKRKPFHSNYKETKVTLQLNLIMMETRISFRFGMTVRTPLQTTNGTPPPQRMVTSNRLSLLRLESYPVPL